MAPKGPPPAGYTLWGVLIARDDTVWTLWDGFQTLPRRSNASLTREDVILPHPDRRPQMPRNAPPTRPKRPIWKKRDSFQTLCSGGCLKVTSMSLPPLRGGGLDRCTRTALRRQPDHDHRPPRSARGAPTPRRPENDRLPGRPSLRALLRGAFPCRCSFRIRCPCKDAGPGVSAGRDTHQRASRLEPLKPSENLTELLALTP